MKDFLKSFNILSEQEIAELSSSAIEKRISKNDFLIKEGQISNSVAFIKSGLFRSYYYSSAGEEVTYCITFPNVFITAYSSFILGQPTSENIQAITNADLLIIPKEKIESLGESSINWMKFQKIIAELQYIELENRIFLLQKEKASLRYEVLLKSHPEFIKHIPLNYLASYLGITQRHLSRLRKELVY